MIRGVVVKGYCSVQETARRWGISVRWVNQYVLDGKFQARSNWADPGRFRKTRSNRKSTDPGPSRKKCQRKAAGRTKQISTERALFFAERLADSNKRGEANVFQV